MPVIPIRRHRLVASVAVAAMGLGLLAGCAGQSTPDSYSDSVERNFLQGCTETAKKDGASFDAVSYCQCAYDELSGDGGVEFGEFKEVNEDQVEDPGPLPASFTRVFDRCQDETGATTPTTESTTDGSAPDEDSTTSTTEG